MNIFWCFFILTILFRDGGSKVFTENQLDIVLSLAKYFRVAFCVFGINDKQKNVRLASNYIHHSKGELLTSWLTFREISRFLSNMSKPFQHNGKTMIVLGMDKGMITSLSQISEVRSLSSAIWVVFLENKLIPEVFRNVYIPFDCEFICVSKNDSLYSITELYQIKKNSDVKTYDFGFWTYQEGLRLVNLNFYARRNSLKGHTITGIIKNDPPYVFIEMGKDGGSKFGGYLYEIWNELEYRINFRTDFPEKYFDKNPEEVLNNEEVDFALARISNNPSAFKYMDFSHPIDRAKFYMFGHRPGSELDWDSYLKPFSPNTWFVNLAWMLTSSLALAILYKMAWNFGTSEREANYFIFTFSESVLTVFRAICMQGSDVTPRSNSCRLHFLSIYFTALVVTSAFSAALFSLLTVPKPRSPFNSLDEVLNNRRYIIGLPAESNFYKLIEDFSNTLSLSKQIKLLEKLVEAKGKLPLTPQEGLRRLCFDKMYVFMFDLPNVLYLMQNMTRSCQDKILPSGPPLFTQSISFGFKKHNPYKKLIDYHLIRMRNEGILNRLLLNYWPPQIPSVQVTWVRVTLSDISPILYMFVLGILLGAMLLYGEKIFLHFRKGSNIYHGSIEPKPKKLPKQQKPISGHLRSRTLSNLEVFLRNTEERLLTKVN